jgi:hypothetical protein
VLIYLLPAPVASRPDSRTTTREFIGLCSGSVYSAMSRSQAGQEAAHQAALGGIRERDVVSFATLENTTGCYTVAATPRYAGAKMSCTNCSNDVGVVFSGERGSLRNQDSAAALRPPASNLVRRTGDMTVATDLGVPRRRAHSVHQNSRTLTHFTRARGAPPV